ncbi:hypothetical protein [Paraherbaspirillum soli]|uniref:Porin n=1 Tax=Paraherbaspirillum soli TaxID=631222 RepID=A0ABW0MBR6_9BURK
MSTKHQRARHIVLGCALICWLPVAQSADLPAGDDGGYVSAALGNGILYGNGAGNAKPMRWRAAEIRAGREMDMFGLVSGGHIPAAEAPRLDVVYYNEGHPDNNHRDGYALQMVYRKNLQPRVGLELAAGPYLSMNRTTINGNEIDDARVGALFSVALLTRLDQYSPGLHVRLAYNHVMMPGAPSTDALLLGIGKELGAVHASASEQPGGHPVWLAASGGFAQTNHSGPGKRFSYQVEAKSYYGLWAASLSGIEEGDDGVRVNRRGIAAQGWYVQPINENWSISAGAGPYLGKNKRDLDHWAVSGLMTIQVARDLGRDWKAFTNFGRVITFKNRNDADLFSVGLMRRFDL